MGWRLGFFHIHDIGPKNPQTLGRGRFVKKKTKVTFLSHMLFS
jgi:hypothetical protein